MKLDFSDVQDFDVVPPGTYPATVYDVELRYGNESGEPYFNWEFKLQGGEHDGRSIYSTTSLQPNALWKIKQFLEALEYEIPDGEFDFEPAEVLGRECRVQVRHRKYQDRVFAQCNNIYPPNGGEVKSAPKTLSRKKSSPKKAKEKTKEDSGEKKTGKSLFGGEKK